MTQSFMDFQDVSKQEGGLPTYKIKLTGLRSLGDHPGTCWKVLFPSTVMASGFPVPSCPDTKGLRIPFDAMLEMAEILYDVILEDDDGNDAGVYFEGISYTLYPTAYIQSHNTIQWHLESKGGHLEDREHDHAIAPDSGGRPKWERISDLKTLRSATAILGYCNEVKIQLGTAERVQYFDDLRASLSHIERPPQEASGGSVGAGFNVMGFVNGTFSKTFKPRNGLKRAKESAKELDYTQVLNITEKESVVLYDTEPGNERAWMVSELPLILELFNFWAFRNGVADIKYAKPGPNGGAEAKSVLADLQYAKRIVVPKILDSESNQQIGDIIKGIYGRIQQCRKEDAGSDAGAREVTRLGRTPIVGWDLLDLTDLCPTTSYRREAGRHLGQQRRHQEQNSSDTTGASGSLTSSSGQPCWLPFTTIVPVFFGQSMGELFIPARPHEVCRQWYPIPGGLEVQYLAASVHCIRSLARDFGHNEPWRFFDNFVWLYEDQSVFEPCVDCLSNAKVCAKQPQVLKEMKNTLHKERPGPAPMVPQVEDNGAVVFARKRKTIHL